METPVLIEDDGVKKCVPARSMYESCVSHQQCSFRTPNLKCVDFLCYCPLPFVLTKTLECLNPSASQTNIAFAVAPSLLLLVLIVMIAGGYVYKRVESGRRSRGNRRSGRCSSRRSPDSPRRTTSAIRASRKHEPRLRTRLSPGKHDGGAPGVTLEHGLSPFYPDSGKRDRSGQRAKKPSPLRTRTTAEEKQGSPSMGSTGDCRAVPPAVPKSKGRRRQELFESDSQPTSSTTISLEPSTEGAEVPWPKPAEGRGARQCPSTWQLHPRDDPLRKVLNDATVTVSVEHRSSSPFDVKERAGSNDGPSQPRRRASGEAQQSPPAVSHATDNFVGQNEKDSVNENSPTNEAQCESKATCTGPSLWDCVGFTGVVATVDKGVQSDEAIGVDRSQQTPDQPSFGPWLNNIAPVHKSIRKAEAKQVAADIPVHPVKINHFPQGCEKVSSKENKIKKSVNFDVTLTSSSPESTETCGERRASFLKHVLPKLSQSFLRQTVAKEPVKLARSEEKDAKDSSTSFVSRVATKSTAQGGRSAADTSRSVSVDDKGDTKNSAAKGSAFPTPTMSGARVIGYGVSSPNAPNFSEVLKELVMRHQKRMSSNASVDDQANENSASQKARLTPNMPEWKSDGAPCSATAKEGTLPSKLLVNKSPYLRMEQQATKSLSPLLPRRPYMTAVDESATTLPSTEAIKKGEKNKEVEHPMRDAESRDMGAETTSALLGLFDSPTAVQGSVKPLKYHQDGEKVGNTSPHSLKSPPAACKKAPFWTSQSTTGGKRSVALQKSRENTDVSSPGSLNFPTALTNDPKFIRLKRFWYRPVDGENETPVEEQAALKRDERLEDRRTFQVGAKFSKTTLENSLSMSEELLFAERRRSHNFMSPFSQASPPRQLSLREELQAAEAEAETSVEQSLKHDWGLVASKAVIGSLDVAPDQSSPPLPRRPSASCVDANFQMLVPHEESGPLEVKASKPRKRVQFQEKPFADVLAEIEGSYSEIQEGTGPCEGDQHKAGNEDHYAEGSLSSCDSKLEPIDNVAIVEFNDAAEGGEDFNQRGALKQGQKELPAAEDPTTARTIWKRDQVVALQYQTLVDRRELKGQGASSGCPSRSVLYGASSVDDVLRLPFCSSGEGPLPPSASTTLSFLSSDTSVSLAHRVSDLTSLHALATLAVQLQETGDGKSQTGVADFAEKQKPGCTPQEELLFVRPNRPEQQQGQTQLQREYPEEAPVLHRPRSWRITPPASQRAAMDAHSPGREGLSKQLSSEYGAKKCNAAPLSMRPDTRERHRMGRFTTRERRWNGDIMRAILMGSQASLGEQSAMLPRLLPAELMSMVLPAETGNAARQIERVPSSSEARASTSGFLQSDLATQKRRGKMSAKGDTTVPALSRGTSSSSGGRASPQTNVLNDASLASASQHLSLGPSEFTLSEPYTARHSATFGPSGEQRKVGTIAKEVCDTELADHKTTWIASGRDASGLKADDVIVELVRSPVQLTFLGDNGKHLMPSLPSEIGHESELRTPSPQLDARERGLVESVKMLVEAFGETESFSNAASLPCAEDLLTSEMTSTFPSHVAGTPQSQIDCTFSLDPCCSLMSHVTPGGPKRARSRRLPSRMPEGLCFETIYNYIMQYGVPPPGFSASIPVLGSLDMSGQPADQGTFSATLPEQSCFRSQSRGYNATFTTEPEETSGPTSAAPELTQQEHRAGEFDTEGHVVSSRRVTEDHRLIPRSRRVVRGGASPRRNRPRRRHGSLGPGTPRGGQDVLHPGEGSEVARRSSFISFDQSGSETSLLQEAGAQERPARSPPSSADRS
ncbi:uncharacterized protein LOC144175212 [Haemaphysalis longicornis]